MLIVEDLRFTLTINLALKTNKYYIWSFSKILIFINRFPGAFKKINRYIVIEITFALFNTCYRKSQKLLRPLLYS